MRTYFLIAAIVPVMLGCAQPQRMGMIEDPQTGFMWGSAVERNLVIDASQFVNSSVKVTVRNVSGDTAYDTSRFRERLQAALRSKGYGINDNNDFGIRFDVNVIYSGYIRTDLSNEFTFLGGLTGAVAGSTGNRQFRNSVGGAIAGATLGSILGSHTKDETYILVTEVTIAVADQYRGKTKKTITFSSSPPLQEEIHSSVKPFETILRSKVAVYAGGRNTSQSQIANGTSDRLLRIVGDII